MTKTKGKGDRHEKVQAGTGSAAGEPADKAPIGNPQDAAGSGAALAGGNPPAPATSVEGGGHVGGAAELGTPGETLASAGAGSAGKPDDEGLGDEQGRTDESGVAAGQAPEAGAGGDAAPAGNPTSDNDSDGSADGTGAGDAGEASGSAGSEKPDVEEPAGDFVIDAAELATVNALDHLVEMFDLPELDRLKMIAGYDTSGATNVMAALIRKIGRDRALPHVVLQELVLRKHREDVPPTRAELMLARIFTTVLTELDQFEKDWAADLEAAKPKPVPVPVPLDETTLEGVDGPMDTY